MIDVGPHYGVRAYFRDLREKTRNLAGPASEDWFERACAATRRPMTSATIKGVVDDHQEVIVEHGGFGFIENWTTVLGKPACHSTGYIPIAASIRNHPVDGSPAYDEDVVIVRRLDMEISQNKLAYSMATAHLAISRHALERLYARAGCDHATFAHTVEDELLRTLCGLAIAAAAEIGHVSPSRPADYHHQAVPFGSGLMILDGRLFTDWNAAGPRRMPLAQYHVIKGGKSIPRRPLLSRFNSMTLEHPEIAGETVWASRVFTSRTYVDRDDMGRPKAAYYETFNRLLDDYDFQPLLQAYFRPRPNEDREPIEIDLPGAVIDMLTRLRNASDDIFNVDRALPICSVRTEEEELEQAPERKKEWRPHDGDPVDTCDLIIGEVVRLGEGPRSYARGRAIVRSDGDTPRSIGFMVQGINYANIADALVPGASLRVPVRWTGKSSVTILGSSGKAPRPGNRTRQAA